MNFLKTIFGKPKDLGYPKFNYEIEFLSRLKGVASDPIFGQNTYWPNHFKELLGELGPIVKKMISNGFLEISSKEEVLTVPQLKEILNNNDLSTSGNKQVLCKRVKEEVRDKSYEKGLSAFFKITETGKKIIESYFSQFSKEYALFLHQILGLLLEGKIKEAENRYFFFQNMKSDQRSIGESFEKFSDKTLQILNLIRKNKALYFEGGFNGKEKNDIMDTLNIFAITFPNFHNSEPSPFFLEKLSNVNLSKFKEYLSQSKKVKAGILDNLPLVIGYYLHFEYSFLYNKVEISDFMNRSKSDRFRSNYSGIQILNRDCECNEVFGEERFSWDELDKIPEIPRLGNCNCIYLPYKN